MSKHGKRYDDAKAQIDPEGNYRPLDAFRLLVSQEVARFDTTVEAHFRLGVNVRHAEEQLRGTIALPHGTGRAVTVAVFAEGEKAREAEEAGAQVVGGEDLVKRVEEGFTDFDVAIATPDMMGAVGRLGRVLGPSGKMPNPKTGTVTFDVGKAVADVIGGKVEYRTDRAGIVHEVSRVLASHGVNVESLETECVPAPMSADMLFKAEAHLGVYPQTDLDALRDALENLTDDLMVELRSAD